MEYEEAIQSDSHSTETFSAKVPDEIWNCGGGGGSMQFSGCCPGCFLLLLAIFWGHFVWHSYTESWRHLPSKRGAWSISFLPIRMQKYFTLSKLCHGKDRPHALLSCSSRRLLLAAALLRSLVLQQMRLPPTNLATLCLHFSINTGGIT